MITSIPFYSFFKDVISWWKWEEKDKEVGPNYKVEGNSNTEYRWETPDRIQEKFGEGFTYVYEEDKVNRIRYRVVWKRHGIVENILIKKLLK